MIFIKPSHIAKISAMVMLSLILEKIKIFIMPFGGSITLGKYVPLVMISYKCGLKTGIFASLICSLLHFIFMFKIPPTKTLFSLVSIIFLDYILSYILVALAPFFDLGFKRFKMYIGTAISFILKILVSTVSGAVFWSEYIPKQENIWIYSLCYAGIYLIPEYFITIFMLKKLEKFF